MDNNEFLNPENHPALNLEQPFGMVFSWKGKEVAINLKNGEDVLKLADLFEKLLENNSIPYERVENELHQS